tara:strand:+ start:1381 stop:1815 length:435 start_codon:yes stop_codon:yes gene_type:complete
MLKVGDQIVWVNTRTKRPLYGKITGETGKRWKVSGSTPTNRFGGEFKDNKKRYMVEKSKASISGRSQALKNIREQYKKLSWTPARRKELDKLLPTSTGAQTYSRKGKEIDTILGFILYFKDGKEKKFPYPRVDGRVQDNINYFK